MDDRLEVVCPCCRTKLTLDTSGEILAEERPKVDVDRTFEKAMGEVRDGARKREDAFSKAFERTQKLDDLLDRKFDEARKKAAKDKSKPPSPFDLD